MQSCAMMMKAAQELGYMGGHTFSHVLITVAWKKS